MPNKLRSLEAHMKIFKKKGEEEEKEKEEMKAKHCKNLGGVSVLKK